MLNKLKRGHVLLIVILLFLAILNPTYSDFKSFAPEAGTPKKTANFIVFSIYSTQEGSRYDFAKDKYVGFLKNFVHFNHWQDTSRKDSTSVMPDKDPLGLFKEDAK
jgi:hypothetical protein